MVIDRPGLTLSQLADDHLGSEPGQELGLIGPASRELQEVIRSETHTHPFIGSLFWQAFTSLRSYRQILEAAGLYPGDSESRQEIIVRHGLSAGFWSRLDLVVLDDGYMGREPVRFIVDVDAIEVAQSATEVWRASELGSRGLERPARDDLFGDVVLEVARAERFGIVVAAPPETILTGAAPTPAWPVSLAAGSDPDASVGVVAVDAAGRSGVTSAHHAFGDGDDVFVAGQPAKIVSRDPISDSVFIEVPGLAIPARRPVTGPLSGTTPGEGETVEFDGAGSGSASTIVTGWDKGIPFEVKPWNRLRVLTEAITNDSDSGAALVNGAGRVVGFAFDRTGFAARIAYSSWIWAEFVYRVHGLK